MKLLYRIADAISGNKRQTGDMVLSIAQRGVKRPDTVSMGEIKSLCASVISQARR